MRDVPHIIVKRGSLIAHPTYSCINRASNDDTRREGAMFQMLDVFAEFERAIIRARTDYQSGRFTLSAAWRSTFVPIRSRPLRVPQSWLLEKWDMFGDPLFWILVFPGLVLGVYAQSRIKINIAKYSQVRTKDGITGAQVARRLLDSQGLQTVAIESTSGMLSDHYDPRSKTLRLSQGVYFAPSVAAAGIAAHETGHALQDAVGYFPLEARTSIVPLVQLASQTAPWLFIAGTLLQSPTLAWVGIILFGSSSLFALITLPVEFNASARARELLVSHDIISGDEQIFGVQHVLRAAAWTYVAAAVSAIGTWLFYVVLLLSQARSVGRR